MKRAVESEELLENVELLISHNYDSNIVEDYSTFQGASNETLTEDNHHTKKQSVESRIAVFMLRLRTEKSCTHSALNSIATFITGLLSEIEDETSTITEVVAGLTSLSTQKKRMAYFRKHMCYIDPVEKELQVTFRRRRAKTGRARAIQQRVSYQYIPIRSRLEALFSDSRFRNLYFSERPSADGLVRSDRDGDGFKNHPLFSKMEMSLRLQMWTDEVEFCNPLGSKKSSNGKIACFAFSILNLPLKHNSKLGNILPLIVVRSVDLKLAGYNKILLPFMNELRELEEDGMVLKLVGYPDINLFGSLKSVSADTLGAHELFGFLSPSANYFCRLCLTTRKEILSHSNESTVSLPNRADHDITVEEIQEEISHTDKDGVRSLCILNESAYFHVTENRSMDSMHDILEGVGPFIVMLTLRSFDSKHPEYGIDANFLNSRINLFDFGPFESKNKPSPIFQDKKIRNIKNHSTQQRAAQNWCLIRMLPFLIGDRIDCCDAYYELLLTLLSIMDIIFAPTISKESTVMLELLIDSLYAQYRSLYKDVAPINKFHHLIHYPVNLRANGPSVGNWCMRYEAFHNTFKRLARISNNFINVPKSVAMHLQLNWCKHMHEKESFQDLVEISTSTSAYPSKINSVFHKFFIEHSITDKTEFFNWIEINGFLFRENAYVVIRQFCGAIDEYHCF